MRLLNTNNFKVESFGDEIPPYAILSHTWDDEEVTLQDMEGTRAANKKGYAKVKNCCSVARANGFEFVWIDTCCIDKTSSAELSEAINSMFFWYQEAEMCYAYLADVPSKKGFSESRWFTRGWTLQELIAPSTVIFFDEKWNVLGTKADLRQDVADCTGIPVSVLSGDDDLEMFSIAERMSWAADRETKRIEDRAYCLMGIFGINMPLIYGERETAFIRLQEEIMRISDDHSLFAWKSPDNRGGLLATSPASFKNSSNIVQFNPFHTFNSPLTVSSRGVHLEIRFIGRGRRGLGLAILHCKERGERCGEDKIIAINVRDLTLTMERFERVQSEEFELVDLKRFKPSQYPIRRICIQIGRIARIRKSGVLGKCDNISPEDIYPSNILADLMNFGDPATLLRAAGKGLEDLVWLLLTRSDVEVDLKDTKGKTALTHAVMRGYETVVRMLLARRDINTNSKDQTERTPLSWAAGNGHEAVVKLLLNSGAELEAKDNDGQTPLSWAARNGDESVVKLLLNNGAELDARNRFNQTPLSCAARNGHGAVVELLLDNGAELETKDEDGRTPLLQAARYGHETVVKLLLDNSAELEAKDKDGRTPLLRAAGNGHESVVKLLLNNGAELDARNKLDQTPLLQAARYGHEVVVKLLLDNSAELELTYKNGETPLLQAARYGHEAVVKLLLGNSAELEAKDNYFGLTPLLWAVRNGHEAVVKLLLDNGAELEAKDKDGRTPLLMAALHGYESVVKLLLNSGAELEAKDNDGRTPLSFATKNGYQAVVKLLLNNGAKLDVKTRVVRRLYH